MLLASCRITDVSEGERKELSYAIVKPGDFPPEIDQILRRKKESAFQMAYESGDDLYILRGYGKQKSGGFSIQIEQLLVFLTGIRTDNIIYGIFYAI